MPNNLYARQAPMNLNIPPSVTIVGCGGIGSWVAILAAMSGVGTLYLFDPDVVEESNRNRLPFCQGSIGQPKVEVVKDFILSIRPDCIIASIAEKLEGDLLEIQKRLCDYFIECTDSPRNQFALYNALKGNSGYTFIRAGYDGTNITVTSNVSGWIKTDVETENYTVQPSWVVPAVTVAALAVGKLLKYPEQEIGLNLSEIGIPAVKRAERRLTKRCSTVNANEVSRRFSNRNT